MFRTFSLFAVSTIVFRLRDLAQAKSVFAQLLGLHPGETSAYRVLEHSDLTKFEARFFALAVLATFLIEWSSRLPQVHQAYQRRPVLRHFSYITGCAAVLVMTRPGSGQAFIYFQF